jgi:DNA-binding beta-propeller fold protein YncE
LADEQAIGIVKQMMSVSMIGHTLGDCRIAPRPRIMAIRLFTRLSLVVLLAAPAGVIAQGAQKGTLLVVNRTGGSISLFDLGTSVEMARVPIGPVIPHEVAISPDGRLALTGEYGPNDNPGRHLVVIDVAEGRQAGRIDLGPQSRPHSIVFMKDGRHAVATLELSDRVALVDVLERRVVRTYPTGGREGHMVRLSPDEARAYVTSRGAAGTLSVISLQGDTSPVVVPTGQGAEGLAVSPDGSEVWVVNRLAGTISIVNTRSLTVSATLDVPPDARRAEISVGGRVLVSHSGPPDAPAQVLSVYDLGRRMLIGRHAMHEGRKGPGGFGIHIAGERAFASDRAGRALLAMDLTNVATARVIATDLDDPDGLAYSPVRVSVLER